jgi:transcriptional regulator with XRE-family HTH domain
LDYLIGEFIKKVRLTKELTQKEVAIKAQITQGAYSKFESGTIELRPTILFNILKILDIPIHEVDILIKNDQNKNNNVVDKYFKYLIISLSETLRDVNEFQRKIESYSEINFLQKNIYYLLVSYSEEFQSEKIPFEESKIFLLWDYFSKYDDYFYYETLLLKSIEFAVPDKYLDIYRKKLSHNLKKYNSSYDWNKKLIVVLLNLATIYAVKKDYEKAIKQILIAKELSNKYEIYTYLGDCYLREGIYKIKSQDSHYIYIDSIDLINSGFNFLETINELDKINKYKLFIDEFLITT